MARVHRSTFESDSAFATGFLTILRHRGQELSPHTQEVLTSMVTSRWDAIQGPQATAAALNLHPPLAQSVTSPTMPSLCFLPIALWANETSGPWDPRVWSYHLRAPKDEDALAHSLRLLNITHALMGEMTPQDALALSAFWQDEQVDLDWNNVYTLDQDQTHTWLQCIVRLGHMHQSLAAMGIKEEPGQGKPAVHLRWASKVTNALDAMTTDQKEKCILHLAQSDLTSPYVLRACKDAGPDVWLRPYVHAALSARLPKSEVQRWPMLPWEKEPPPSNRRTRRNTPGETNQQMMRLYCPTASTLLDALTPTEMWSNRKWIAQTMAQLSRSNVPPETLPGVDGLFESMH